MYNCLRCGKQCHIDPEPKYKVCAECAKHYFDTIRGRYALIPARVIEWVTHAEQNHGRTMFYSDEVLDNPNNYNVTKSQAMQGHCPGFITQFKIFTIDPSFKPSVSLANFMGNSPLVVGECEGFVHGVYLSAIRSTFDNDGLFDVCFSDLQLGRMDYFKGEKSLFWFKDLKGNQPDESSLDKGHWTYIARHPNAMEMFRLHAQKTGQGGAASGWNLICTQVDPVKKYIGFGLSDTPGEVKELTLMEIMAILTKAQGSSQTVVQDFFLLFRRRINEAKLDALLKSVLPTFG